MFKGFKKNAAFQTGSSTNKLVEAIRANTNDARSLTPALARASFAMEGVSDNTMHALNTLGNELSTSLEAIAIDLGMSPGGKNALTAAQVNAATFAGILAGDFKGYMGQKTEFPSVSTESMGVIQSHGLNDAVGQRSFSMEAYDERENRNAVVYSIAYNLQSARQDEFGETLFPTITLSADNVGFGVVVNLMTVYDNVERKITGTFEDFGKKNIIRAVADSTILRKEQTRIVPVNRAQSVDKFVPNAVIAKRTIMLEGESIDTSPLLLGKKVDLLGISQTESLLAGGISDQTYTIDPYVILKNLYATVGADPLTADVLKFDVTNIPLSNFTYSTQNGYRVETLNFTTTSVLVNKLTKQNDGTALGELAGIVTGDLIVRLEIAATGSVNIETGETTVYGNAISVHNIRNAAGEMLDLSIAPAKAIVDAFATAKLIGYDLEAFRTNINMRQRGQFIDVTKYTQLYNVPLRSPITKLVPVNSDGQNDSSDLQALITTTRIRTSNEAVTALLKASDLMKSYIDSRDAAGVGPDIMGVGRFFVRPTYENQELDMQLAVDSLSSKDLPADMQAALVNKVRDIVFRLYRDSEYKAAADALTGGIAPVPEVILATDPVLARYLNVTGDLRLLGGEFNVRIVSSLDHRMAGRIFITFGVFDSERNTAPNPLNFGNMIWAPEMVLTANISRQNTISKETVVQPRYLFVTHCPVMAELNVTNVPDVIAKVPRYFHTV